MCRVVNNENRGLENRGIICFSSARNRSVPITLGSQLSCMTVRFEMGVLPENIVWYCYKLAVNFLHSLHKISLLVSSLKAKLYGWYSMDVFCMNGSL